MNLFAPFNSDGYKLGHAAMYAKGTESVYSNLTPRSDRIYKRNATRYYKGKLVLVGCQGAIIEMVENWDKFFKMERCIAIARFKLLCDNYLGPNVVSVDELSALHKLGYLPLEIKTLDEGSKVPMGIPVLTITNTIAHAYWLVNFLETTISNLTWKASTAATIATEYKDMLKDFALKTGTPMETTLFQAHDFSARGMSGPEDAARTGFGHIAAGHLGTDSLGSVLYAQEYYGGGNFVAASVPATEHAVATSNILRIEKEIEDGEYNLQNGEQGDILIKMSLAGEDPRLIAEVMFLYELMLRFPTGILSYVTDSFDFWAMISKGLPYLKDVILRREGNGITPGKLVIRPDSGDPVEVICGRVIHDLGSEVLSADDWEDSASDIGSAYVQGCDSEDEVRFLVRDAEGAILEVFGYAQRDYDRSMYFEYHSVEEYELSAEEKGAIKVLYEIFGGTETSTGHKLLNEHIGLIYGDSITTQRCLTILERLEGQGYASGNVVFGVGSFTYQCVTRDTFGFAVKATYTVVNGKAIAIFKDPKTDSKKKSAKGLLQVVRAEDDPEGELLLIDNVSPEVEQGDNLLTRRFYNGQFFNMTTIDEIRTRLA